MASASTDPVVKDLTEENRKFFNEQAGSYDHHASHQKVMQIIAEEILKRRKEWTGVAWDEENTRMLDYACGTGIISKILAPYTKQLIGMDISEGMVEQFNQSVQNQGVPSEEMRAIVANLCVDELDPVLSDPDYHDFDVALSTLAFHHFNNVPLAINRIVERLKKGTGVLLIVDFRAHEPTPQEPAPPREDLPQHQQQHMHQHQHHHKNQHQHLGEDELYDTSENIGRFYSGHHTVTHNGFSEEDVKRWYGEAGLVDIEIVDVGPGSGMSMIGKSPETEEVIKMQKRVFMAKGRRA